MNGLALQLCSQCVHPLMTQDQYSSHHQVNLSSLMFSHEPDTAAGTLPLMAGNGLVVVCPSGLEHCPLLRTASALRTNPHSRGSINTVGAQSPPYISGVGGGKGSPPSFRYPRKKITPPAQQVEYKRNLWHTSWSRHQGNIDL